MQRHRREPMVVVTQRLRGPTRVRALGCGAARLAAPVLPGALYATARLAGRRAVQQREVLAMNLRRTGSVFLVVGLLTAAVGGSAVHAQQTVVLTASEFQFVPPTITVPEGQPITIQLTNTGQVPHNLHIEGPGVVVDLVPGGINVAPGQTTSRTLTFTTAGVYKFWCPIGNHRQSGMAGMLSVP